jgi:hypothetical protein
MAEPSPSRTPEPTADPPPEQPTGTVPSTRGHAGTRVPGGGLADDVHLTPGATPVPDYELVQALGRGGFGEVWKATGPGGVQVALKFIRLGEQVGEVELRALDLMKNLRHPHLIGVLGVWHRQELLIIAMELGEGTLKDRLAEAQRQGLPGIPPAELGEHLRDAAKGIDHLTAIHIVHRDIKPQNLLLVGGGVKVADFGLAKLLEHTQGSSSGAMTPAYAAPEFFRGQTTSQSDQYALAVSYCQLRGGRLPFRGTMAELMAGHLSAPPDLGMIPEAERPVVARALAKDPAARWPDCRSFVQALEQAARPGGGSPATVPAGPARGAPTLRPAALLTRLRPGGRRLVWPGAAALAVLVGAAVLWLAPGRHDPLADMKRQEIDRQVSILKSEPPLVLDGPGAVREVARLEPEDNSPFEILSDDRVIDLRQWKEVPPDSVNDPYSAVTSIRRLRLKKVKPAGELRFQGRTSGLDLFWDCPGPYPFQVLALKGDSFVGTERMKARQVVIDVSREPVDTEFDLRTVSTYWNSMQTEQELWFGVIGYERSFKVSMLIVFPASKPYRTYNLMVARTIKDQPVAYNGPKILLTGGQRDWVYWEVPNPQAGYVYRLHWKW